MAAQELSERICALLQELSAGSCSITSEMIEAETDDNTAAILSGLALLWKDLQYQGQRRSEAEAELREREARFRGLFDQAKVPIWDWDISGVLAKMSEHVDDLDGFLASPEGIRELLASSKINNVNRATLSLFGAESVEEFGRRMPDLLSDVSFPMFRIFFTELAGGATRVEVPGRVVTFEGRQLHIVLSVASPRTSRSDPGHAIITVSDVTAQHRARQAAQQMAALRGDELRRVNDEVERLFYAVSHDLRTPLRGVSNLAEWIHDDLKNGDMAEVDGHLALLRGRVTRLETMLSDLLNYARVGRAEHPVERVDVGALLEQVRSDLPDLPEGFHLEWGEMPTIEAQRTLFGQVLYNLVANAVRHHDRDDGRVEVRHELTDGWHRFVVADDGPGIPARFRDRIFAMFSTLKPRDEVEGSGIGLAFVNKVVVMNGGTVRVSATPGGGATFSFTWPTRIAPPPQDT